MTPLPCSAWRPSCLAAGAARARRDHAAARHGQRPRAAGGKVEILFFDVATGATTLAGRLEAPAGTGHGGGLVVRTVELVRAVLLPPPLPAPAPRPRRPPRRDSASATVAARVGGGASAMGGTVVATLPRRGARARRGPLRVGAADVRAAHARCDHHARGPRPLATWVAGGGVFAAASRGRFAFDAALGALALWLRTEGTPTPGYVETTGLPSKSAPRPTAASARRGCWARGSRRASNPLAGRARPPSSSSSAPTRGTSVAVSSRRVALARDASRAARSGAGRDQRGMLLAASACRRRAPCTPSARPAEGRCWP